MIRGLCKLIVWMSDMAAIHGTVTVIAALTLVSVLWVAIVGLVGRSVKR